MSILLTSFSCLDFITGVISIAVQSVIIVSHGDCAYSKMGVGIWNGILLIITAISLLVINCKTPKIKDWALVICAMSLMASLVQVGVASGVIYQLLSLQYFNHGPRSLPEPKRLLGDIVDQFVSGGMDNFNKETRRLNPFIPDSVSQWVTKAGNTLVSNVENKIQIRSCYTLEDTYGSTRTSLEVVLLVCGLIAIIVKLASFLALRTKRPTDTATIQYTQAN